MISDYSNLYGHSSGSIFMVCHAHLKKCFHTGTNLWENLKISCLSSFLNSIVKREFTISKPLCHHRKLDKIYNEQKNIITCLELVTFWNRLDRMIFWSRFEIWLIAQFKNFSVGKPVMTHSCNFITRWRFAYRTIKFTILVWTTWQGFYHIFFKMV